MDFVFTTTQTSNDFVFDSSNDTFTDLTFQGGTYAAGIQGLPGEGVPAGGTTNQALTKIDATDYNTQWQTVDKSFVGLGNVDNTSDADKPVSTAQASALVAKAGDTMTGALQMAAGSTKGIEFSSGDGYLKANMSNGIRIWNDNSTAQFRLLPSSNNIYFQNTVDGNVYFSGLSAATLNGSVIFNVSTAVRPNSDSATTLGAASQYWSNTYTDRLYLNSTAYLDGATAGRVGVSGDVLPLSSSTHVLGNSTNKWLSANIGSIATISVNSNETTSLLRLSGGTVDNGAVIVLGGGSHATIPSIGIGRIGATDIFKWTSTGMNVGNGNLPTHTLTLPSTSTGIAIYNTADTTTNYERVRQYWSTNTFFIAGEIGGSGTARNMLFGWNSPVANYQVSYAGTTKHAFASSSAATDIVGVRLAHTATNSSNTATGVSIAPTINQSGTASATDLLINRTQTATGSGAQLLIDAQVGGVSKFSIDNTGKITTALSQTYTATNVTTDRSYDANATTLDEVADVLGTLIADLRAVGVVK